MTEAEEKAMQALALIMTVSCVRNTVIEDYHARGSLSQADMREFNREVVNRLYTALVYLLRKPAAEQERFFMGLGTHYPYDWDDPIFLESWAENQMALADILQDLSGLPDAAPVTD